MAQREVELRKATQIDRESAKLLASENIQIGTTEMAPKRALGVAADTTRQMLQTNVYGLLLKAVPVFRYDIAINGITQSGRSVELTKKVSGDALQVDRRSNCRDVMMALKRENPDFFKFSCGNAVYYDLQSLMYTLIPLDVHPVDGGRFTVPVENLGIFFNIIEIYIKPILDAELTLADFSVVTSDVGLLDKSMEQFLNLATSQELLFNKNEFITFSSAQAFMINPENYGFRPEHSPSFHENGTYLGLGIQKGIRYIEGPRAGGRNAGVVVEVKRTPFHNVEPVISKATRFISDFGNLYNGDRDRLIRYLKGLQVETIYGRKQKFLITGISADSAMQKRIVIGSEEQKCEVSIAEYFFTKYNISLNQPHLPLLEARGRNGTNFYPMELCLVSDNQRVRSHQQTPRQTQEMIKACAVPPAVLRDQTALVANSMKLVDNEYLNAAKIRFLGNPLNVNARILPPPSFQFGGGNVAQARSDNFQWQGRQFIVPASCRVWAAYAFRGGARDSISDHDFLKFVERFLAEARSCGMNMSDPADVRYLQSDPQALKSELHLASQNAVEYVLVAHPDNADEMHAALKLCERDFGVITQGLRIGTVRNVLMKNQMITLQNIVNKTNIKLGGLNFSLVINNPITQEVLGTRTLFIGLGQTHPASVPGDTNGNGNGNGHENNGSGSDNSDIIDQHASPTTIGYSANIGADPFEFIGGFFYQEQRRDEKVNIIRQIVRRCLAAFRNNQRANPSRIIIYRNGCGEGQFASILKYEVPLIKAEAIANGCNAGLTLLVVNKLQNIRFFATNIDSRAKPPDQNVQPGTCVDNGVVHPIYSEFFLNAHRALQGTARTPKYTILYDDNNLSMDHIEGITYHLCFGHQIVYMPTSLPSPVYIANRYAERGNNLYRRYKVVTSSDYEPRRYSELTDRLGYENIDMFNSRRINA